MTDEKLAAAAVKGDDASLELLVRRYYPLIFRYLFRLTAEKALAEELSQETFLKVVRSFQQGKTPDNFRPWIYRIASNICRDLWKSAHYKRVNLTTTLSDLEEEESENQTEAVIDLLSYQEERKAVVKALAALSPDLQQVIVLRFYEEMKIKEISQVLDAPVGTIKSRLYRAYRFLEEKLSILKEERGVKHDQ